MDEIKVFSNEQYDELKGLKKSSSYIGFVYILEWGDKTKIGCSTNPSKRIDQLKATALYGEVNVGRIAITPGHTNYLGTENFLHKYYAKYRIEGTELFSLGFDEILTSMPVLPFECESQMTSMGNKVKERRKELRMSQEELSEKSGVNRTTISMIETGKAEQVMTGTLIALAMALNTTVGNIFCPD